MALWVRTLVQSVVAARVLRPPQLWVITRVRAVAVVVAGALQRTRLCLAALRVLSVLDRVVCQHPTATQHFGAESQALDARAPRFFSFDFILSFIFFSCLLRL